ncbi:hypothetical protein QBC39DRAFT_348284 [Podospora conica]|nr:hypothetical protein QBC39DRAFT_348284 [Schizothecium conicum]
MVSLTTIAALLSATLAAAANLPPHHGEPHKNSHATSSTTTHLGPGGYSYGHATATATSTASASTAWSTSTKVAANIKAAQTGPTTLTMTVINQAGHAVSTTHGNNPDVPLPTIGMPPSASMAPGEKHVFHLPLNFAGRLAVSKGAFFGDESLIEYTFDVPAGFTANTVSINVSYVAGFSVNINCFCSDGRHLSGCTELLWKHPELCPNVNTAGSCPNPLRGSGGPPADAFFLPCEHKAYTYVTDHKGALSVGECLTGDVTCSILPGGP